MMLVLFGVAVSLAFVLGYLVCLIVNSRKWM